MKKLHLCQQTRLYQQSPADGKIEKNRGSTVVVKARVFRQELMVPIRILKYILSASPLKKCQQSLKTAF